MGSDSLYQELKRDRSIARDRILDAVSESLIRSMKGGFFPDFKSLTNSIMDEISGMMDEFPHIETNAWSIILQEKNPDKFCDKTQRFINRSEEDPPAKSNGGNGATAVESPAP